MNLKCPCCNNRTILLRKRLLLTPLGVLKCDNCGSKLSLPPLLSVTFSLIHYAVVVYFAFLLVLNQSVGYFLLLIVLWIGFEIVQLFIPLICKDRSK